MMRLIVLFMSIDEMNDNLFFHCAKMLHNIHNYITQEIQKIEGAKMLQFSLDEYSREAHFARHPLEMPL